MIGDYQDKSTAHSHAKASRSESSNQPKLILIIGGARSGKSSFAQQLAQHSKREVAFIATATAGDDDMRERIARHRASRPPTWHTIEEPLHLARAIQQAAHNADILLLDCITLWLSNWLASSAEISEVDAASLYTHYEEEALAEIDALIHTFASLPQTKTLLVVTNEVGLGVVPPYPLGRAYRDILGLVNQRLAAEATHVYLLVAGIPIDIKRLQAEITLD